MHLTRLIIYKKENNEIIRDVKFNSKGLNLIVDLENDAHGSSIGKTTFARCINICLGSKSIKDIYHSNETGDSIEIKDFIINNKVSVILYVQIDDAKKIKLERCLYETKLQYINDKLYEDIEEYKNELKHIFFPNSPNCLKFREMITKFIRIDKGINLIFKYNDGYTKNRVYHNAYYYFLNLYINEQENDLKKELSDLSTENVKIRNKYKIKDESAFDEMVSNLELETKEKKKAIKENDYISDFENQDNENVNAINELDLLTTNLYLKKQRLQVLYNRIRREKNNILDIDVNALKAIYDDAKLSIENLNKTFEDFVAFHNGMCEIRVQNYAKEIDTLKSEVETLEKQVTESRNAFSNKFVEYKVSVNDQSGSLYDEYINKKLEYNEAQTALNNFKNNKIRIDEISNSLADISNAKNSNEDNKKLFNSIFNSYCKKILNQDNQLEFNDDIDKFPLTSQGTKGQLGTGDKKSIVAALDFSFVEFFDRVGKVGPRFVIHDQMENATLEELKNVFEECRKSNVQYILPILSDRISTLNVNDSEVILKLSKKEKLFKI